MGASTTRQSHVMLWACFHFNSHSVTSKKTKPAWGIVGRHVLLIFEILPTSWVRVGVGGNGQKRIVPSHNLGQRLD